MKLMTRLHWAALLLALFVVVAGAFVRLSDAGLGCPDWPHCFGDLVGIASEHAAQERYPDSEYDERKAWIEVGHRYLAALLGLLIVIIAIMQWRRSKRLGVMHAVVVAVIAQGLLGMLTVTQLLKPAIVVSHLFGGMLILSLLTYALIKQKMQTKQTAAPAAQTTSAPIKKTSPLARLAAAALVALFLQIILGGWVSASYAGLSCPDFPTCQKQWTPPTIDFSGYSMTRELHADAAGGPITAAALATIHWTHRLGALVLTLLFIALIIKLWQHNNRPPAIALGILFTAQAFIGIATVAAQLPLSLALAHNATAALLVIMLTATLAKLTTHRQ